MNSERSGKSELTRALRPFRKELVWTGMFSLISNVLMLTPTIYMLQLYDRVFRSRNEATLFDLTVIMIFFYAVMAFADRFRSRILVRSSVRIDQALNAKVFDAGFERALRQADGNASESFADLTTIRQFLTGNGIFIFFDAPWMPVYIAVIFLLHPLLGRLSILFALVQLLVAVISHRSSAGRIALSLEEEGKGRRYLSGKLRNIEAVHSMGMLGNIRREWLHFQDRALGSERTAFGIQHRQQAISKFVRYSMQSLTLAAGALLVIDGKLAVGGMIAGNFLMSRALQPLDMAIGIRTSLVQAIEAFRRLDKLLADNPPAPQGEATDRVLQGAVSIEDLMATVPGRKEPILDHLSAVFPAGSVVAVTGPSGSGKSTFARCLVGAWPFVQGDIRYNGHSIRKFSREQRGSRTGYLPQDIELFDGTIADNIARFGELDSIKVIEAARRTGIHEMILRFPKGYDTQTGEAGNLLSGGQRQRIGLARALYDTPSIVVLDEPNANLDDAGERALLRAVLDLKARGSTVILVTHRPAVLGAADLVMGLDKGRISLFATTESLAAGVRMRNSEGGMTSAPAPAAG